MRWLVYLGLISILVLKGCNSEEPKKKQDECLEMDSLGPYKTEVEILNDGDQFVLNSILWNEPLRICNPETITLENEFSIYKVSYRVIFSCENSCARILTIEHPWCTPDHEVMPGDFSLMENDWVVHGMFSNSDSILVKCREDATTSLVMFNQDTLFFGGSFGGNSISTLVAPLDNTDSLHIIQPISTLALGPPYARILESHLFELLTAHQINSGIFLLRYKIDNNELTMFTPDSTKGVWLHIE